MRAGIYVAEHSDLKIAVWDEAAAKGHGGTADIVRYCKDQAIPVTVINPILQTVAQELRWRRRKALRPVDRFIPTGRLSSGVARVQSGASDATRSHLFGPEPGSSVSYTRARRFGSDGSFPHSMTSLWSQLSDRQSHRTVMHLGSVEIAIL